MKKIFSLMVAVVMLVSCFAISTSALTKDVALADGSTATVDMTVENAYPGEIATVTVRVTVAELKTAFATTAYDWFGAFESDGSGSVEYVAGSANGFGAYGGAFSTGECSGNWIGISAITDPAKESVALGGTYTAAISVQLKINAEAGETFTFVDDGSLWMSGCAAGDINFVDVDPDTFTFTVEEKPVVKVEPTQKATIKGAQIRNDKYDDLSDLRFGFELADASAFASAKFIVTINDVAKEVACDKIPTDGIYRVVVENIPADYYGTDISVVMVVTYAETDTTLAGSTTSDAAVYCVNDVAAEVWG